MNILDEIGLITVFLLVLLSLFLFTNSSNKKLPNVLFALFLLTTSFDISALFLQSVYEEYDLLNLLRVDSVFLQMPLFYFYVQAVCYHDFKIEVKQLLHAIPFLGFLVLFVNTGLSNQSYLWYEIATQIQYYGYMAGVFYTLKQFKKLHRESHSLQNETYRWIMTTTLLFLTGNTFVLLRTIFASFDNFQALPLLNLGISLFGLGVICWFVLKTMRSPEIFTQVNQPISTEEKEQVEEAVEHNAEIVSLRNYMKVHKPYLEETLTLQNLAERIDIPEKHLSFLINKVLGKHFFDFINTYRIEEAKKHLQKRDLTIQQIMYEVGFNSKSSFNTAFKKYTSQTPSTYRKSAS